MKEESNLTQLEHLLTEIGRLHTQAMRKKSSDGLTPAQTGMLKLLAHKGSMKSIEFAEYFGVTPAAVTGISDKLASLGFITRERGKDDRRAVYLTLTSQGEDKFNAIVQERKQYMRDIFETISTDDRDHLIRIFSQLLHEKEKLF